ncbi:FmdB family transcriptional regulator [Nocardioides sp. GY 10113]|uniref:FmdB family zinc ribbon protein n=1 Tax=Nocardioides sp. GY 10113 TaxID=2569761 RepID=UPI0010A92244|nr:FmdB family zinc ribbon protein [Nocardioides sp. GY 10113]TIC88237.1 FmdB family transcriptional regulator [Nocardioides sp. GY 10113]
MPTYQYRCSECGHFFEQVQSFSDDALTECPECQGLLRKVFNAVGVVFKGSGFYKTDSRSGANTSASTSAAASSSTSGSSGSDSSSTAGSSSSSSSSSSGSSGSSTGTAAASPAS